MSRFRVGLCGQSLIGATVLTLTLISTAWSEPPVVPKPAADQPVDQTPLVEAGADDSAAKETVASAGGDAYMRILSEDDTAIAMQTATVRFVGTPGTAYEGRTVDLVGVVHIGQLDYYQTLNQQLATYDRVLYELVAPNGTRFKPEDLEENRSLIASIQGGMRDMLNLEGQLEHIDYMAANFRHADMSVEEFSEDMERRGDAVWKMIARMMGAGIAQESKRGGDLGILIALLSDDRPLMLKRMLAEQLVDADLVTAGMSDENGEDTLIQGRNRKAFEVLKEVLNAGDDRVAVFYGAGHLGDMAARLIDDFGMKPAETTWLTAWDLTRP